ncbi:hypothetical protein A6R68_16203 [Neotoma lepida]|uniref:Uncharacterized protein n=1 Tax=Neotoma lepida TaxID=56216 RepID=A0A1A6HI99_NEOLE|nr:hypothetical protein A6R68_16203 [Neotoma lepida]
MNRGDQEVRTQTGKEDGSRSGGLWKAGANISTCGILMLGLVHIHPMSCAQEVPILPVHLRSILPFLLAPVLQEFPRETQLSLHVGPLFLDHNQDVQDTHPQVPTLPHAHHLLLACAP